MKFLILSDIHLENNLMKKIINTYKNKVDKIICCGDTSLLKDDELLKDIDFIVKGNHDDDERYPLYIIYNNILITHGHLFNVYYSYEKLLKICKENNITFCFHGHTHVPTVELIDDIYFINPGSVLINRGPYGFGTFALFDTDDKSILFLHHETFEKVNDIVIESGRETLKEFKKIARS